MTLDELLVAVTEADQVDDSLIALTASIKQQLKEALSGVTIPPAAQAKVDAIFAQIVAGKEKVAAAVLANTDSEPPTA